MKALFLVVCLILESFAGVAKADVFQPVYLEIREVGHEVYDVVWKVPALGEDMRLSMYAVFPEGTDNVTEPFVALIGGTWVERWKIKRDGGIFGQSIRFVGSAVDVTDIITRFEYLDGSSRVQRASMDEREFVVIERPEKFEIATSYLLLGVEHILEGFDHLLFVFALLLLVRGPKKVIGTVTAFTVAHSITLAAATMGWIHVAGPPLEAIISLSIVFLAAEVLHGLRGSAGLTARAPWLVAFVFGLLHGLGFASALAETGLPESTIVIALLMFNIGVELGQLAFVAVTAIAGMIILRSKFVKPQIVLPIVAYCIGTVAAFWSVERVTGF